MAGLGRGALSSGSAGTRGGLTPHPHPWSLYGAGDPQVLLGCRPGAGHSFPRPSAPLCPRLGGSGRPVGGRSKDTATRTDSGLAEEPWEVLATHSALRAQCPRPPSPGARASPLTSPGIGGRASTRSQGGEAGNPGVPRSSRMLLLAGRVAPTSVLGPHLGPGETRKKSVHTRKTS